MTLPKLIRWGMICVRWLASWTCALSYWINKCLIGDRNLCVCTNSCFSLVFIRIPKTKLSVQVVVAWERGWSGAQPAEYISRVCYLLATTARAPHGDANRLFILILNHCCLPLFARGTVLNYPLWMCTVTVAIKHHSEVMFYNKLYTHCTADFKVEF